MRTTLRFLLLPAALCLLASPIPAAVPTLDTAPAATLLLPYFEVDLGEPSYGPFTTVMIGNVAEAPTLAHVTLWTDVGIPTVAFDLYLGGYDQVELDLRLVFHGVVPQTSETLSFDGPPLDHVPFPGCAGLLGQGRLPAATVAALRAAHSGDASSLCADQCCAVNHGDGLMRGYVTIDVTSACTTLRPTDAAYYDGPLDIRNVLWGEYRVVDSAQNFSWADALVHVEADPEHPATDGVPGPNGPDYTFYGRLNGGSGADHREPLATTWMARYVNGGVLSEGTESLVWRDPGPRSPFACGTPSPALGTTITIGFDEQEQPGFPTGQADLFPLAADRVRLADPSRIDLPFDFGFLFLDLNLISPAAPFGGRNQAHVTQVFRAGGRFAGGTTAWPLVNASEINNFSYFQVPACADGVDNDGDGLVDYPEDPGCRESDGIENPPCDNDLDDDGDGLTDYPDDPQCFEPWWWNEASNYLPQCSNNVDDDSDGLVDYPDDPNCSSPNDGVEAATECNDGLDNDGDGEVDLADLGCTSDEDPSETNPACADGLDNDGDTLFDYPDDPGCPDPLFYTESPACSDGVDNDGDSLVDYPDDPSCAAASSDSEVTACSDGVDNDLDGQVDLADPGCAGDPTATDEVLPCMDGFDNDGDGLVDYPYETGCESPGPTQYWWMPVEEMFEGPDCADGRDNDQDGLADYPDDPGCASADDLNEKPATETRQCADGIDNDGDGLVDYPNDPGCISAYDDNEYDPS